ncbi:TPA: helix-turn-helix domain containing protein, partial [Enterococcus faecalis]
LYSMQRSGDMPAVDRSQQRDPHNRRYSIQEDKRIISMYKRGAMYREIGEALGRDERSISGRIHNLIRSGRLKALKTKRWTDEETQLLIDATRFDDTGHVNNYEELMRLLHKNYLQVSGKIAKLRKAGKITVYAQSGTTSEKSKQAMNRFNNARFAHVPKKKEEVLMNGPDVSIESKQVSLILTTVIVSGQRIDQYFTQEGELIATTKKPTSSANEVSH